MEKNTAGLTGEGLAKSLAAMSEARASNRMEGLRARPQDEALLDALARGEIDGAEFDRRMANHVPKALATSRRARAS